MMFQEDESPIVKEKFAKEIVKLEDVVEHAIEEENDAEFVDFGEDADVWDEENSEEAHDSDDFSDVNSRIHELTPSIHSFSF